ncbi:MAG: amidohydrolase family protein, partial [Clostridiales bacterium]|nr:amidohydrolase family protein [Clostridiales bacterium]
MKTQKVIGLEEHFITPDFEMVKMESGGANTPQAQFAANISKHSENLGEKRIAEMDEAGIDMQIISLTAPGTQVLGVENAVEYSRKANDTLGQAIAKYPKRFAGFATLPTILPEEAAKELQMAVKQYGFKGAVINGHTQGRYLDDMFFDPILAEAEQISLPIYLHPAEPVKAVKDTYYTGNFSAEVAAKFSMAGWGWHIETAV